MTIPSSGISFSSINTELRRSSTQTLNINDMGLRNLAGQPSGEVSIGNLANKTNTMPYMFTPAYNYSDILAGTDSGMSLCKNIWPATSPAQGQGWVGKKFTPDVSTAYLTAFCDDSANCYINGEHVLDVGMSTTTVAIALKHGIENSISIYVDDIPGGARQINAIISKTLNYNDNTNGNIIAATDETWVSQPT